MKQVRKAIAALVLGVAGWLAAALVDNHISPAEWGQLAGVIATAAGVYVIPNARPKA